MKSTRIRPPERAKPSIGSYKVEQRQIIYRRRAFHFVSYENLSQPSWFLMNEGGRWEVMPQTVGEDPEQIDQRLRSWLERNIA